MVKTKLITITFKQGEHQNLIEKIDKNKDVGYDLILIMGIMQIQNLNSFLLVF